MAKVKVYYFKAWDGYEWNDVRSPRQATLEAIATAEGKAMMETAIEIDESELDGNGFRKVKTT